MTQAANALDEDLLRTWLDLVIKAQRRTVDHPEDPDTKARTAETLRVLERMAKYLEERK